ncbi:MULTISPECIES: sugar kinase [Streptomyces]|uniref:sugar kinase n=1 Tax=Streptomyces TaxID=1883 RepID=UPI00103B7C26|nr:MULTISPECIES: sugar kinase [Streptomyces]MBT3074834.1 sugar kinase [Streptomyces sp. COG21]MBT3081887.1 sugar kinase [Streptomyces sp. COG20]MBT3085080.1 sugar kinase [Streptomyces sp. CYG21]MBT3098152.1 sugar kinase [Streptomyces sp. CBG30]MBT3105818.1 sugar kinase [Streptomyces sp. COG19]
MSTGAAPDVVTLGETMAVFRSFGPLRMGGDLRLSVAGAESNVAVGLTRLGHRARWIGRVGDDELGTLVLRSLRAESVDTTGARTDPEAPTGLLLSEPRIADLTRIQYYRTGSAGSRLGPEDVAPALLDGARILHVSGITCALGPRPLAAVHAAVRAAHAAGMLVSLDVNHRPRLWSSSEAAAVLRPLAREADLVIASDDELALAAEPRARTVADRVRSLLSGGRTREVAVKLGGDGAELHTAEGRDHTPARRVAVRDTVGAGDAFTAGLLSGVLDGLGTRERLERANTVGAFAVGSEGDWQGLPERRELALLDREDGATLR